MRVLLVHNKYQLTAGEDAVVANERNLLEANGWQTRLWSVDNFSIAGPLGKINAAAGTVYSRSARDALADVIADYAPDVVHVHNFFPLLSPSIYDACRDAGVAVAGRNGALFCRKAKRLQGHQDAAGGVDQSGCAVASSSAMDRCEISSMARTIQILPLWGGSRRATLPRRWQRPPF